MAKQQVLQAARRNALFNLVVDGDTATTPLAAPVASPTKPTTGIIEIAGAPLARFIFGATDTPDDVVNYQINAWYKCKMPSGVRDTWIGVVLAQGDFTVGTLAIAGITTGFFADEISDDVSTRTSVTSTIGNNVAMLTVDTHNAKFLQIVTDLADAQKAYAWHIPGDFSR